MEHTETHELSAAYALDALDPHQRHEFEEHLLRCAECRETVSLFQETAAALAYHVEMPAPPRRLRGRILEQARRERANVVPLHRRRWVLPASSAVAAAAACAAIGIGLWANSLSNSLDGERAARQAQARALAVLAQPGTRRLPVVGAAGALVVARNGDAALILTGVKRSPAHKTYEAWVLRNGKAARAAVFSGGPRESVVALTRTVPPGAAVGVTLERAGGVDVPTQAPFIRTGKV